jgi:hypothetical protein
VHGIRASCIMHASAVPWRRRSFFERERVRESGSQGVSLSFYICYNIVQMIHSLAFHLMPTFATALDDWLSL